jgi:hypothetical protein
MAVIKSTTNNKCGKDTGKMEPSNTAVENVS